jgi:hypothetical protein
MSVKQVPCPGALSTVTWPPCACTLSCTRDKPHEVVKRHGGAVGERLSQPDCRQRGVRGARPIGANGLQGSKRRMGTITRLFMNVGQRLHQESADRQG